MSIFNQCLHIPYNNSRECQLALYDVEAIDYFFAKQVIAAQQQHSSIVFNETQYAEIFHVLLALSFILRQGSLCLAVDQIAEQHWWLDTNINADINTSISKNISANSLNVSYQGYKFDTNASITSLLTQFIDYLPSQAYLVFKHQLLYSKRYWQYEFDFCQFIAEKLEDSVLNSRKDAISHEKGLVDICMDELFHVPVFAEDRLEWQQLAAINTLYSPFSIITGGAGTGKTYTITRIAVLLSAIMKVPVHSIELVAPTGKAANRMLASLHNELDVLLSSTEHEGIITICQQLKGIQPKTINSLLKTDPVTGVPAYSQSRKLAAKVVFVDETSMIDISLMNKLVKSLAEDTQLILVGDPNQLPSVENGCLLADLVSHLSPGITQHRWDLLCDIYPKLRPANEYARKHIITNENAEHTLVAKSTVNRLHHSLRSNQSINAFAQYILDGNAKLALAQIQNNNNILNFVSYTAEQMKTKNWLDNLVQNYVIDKFAPLFTANTPQEAFEALSNYALLSPFRKTNVGTEVLNLIIESQLAKQYAHIHVGQAYRGKPIMIMKNDYNLSLFNGDIGFVWHDNNNKLVACFNTPKGIVMHPIFNLPQHELSYAMTVHKTQGSEFDSVDLILPIINTSFLNKQLVYTGVTRAKKRLRLFTNEITFSQAIQCSAQRISGIQNTLGEAISACKK